MTKNLARRLAMDKKLASEHETIIMLAKVLGRRLHEFHDGKDTFGTILINQLAEYVEEANQVEERVSE